MILLLDNYDSFTYNLADALSPFGEVLVVRHDRLCGEELEELAPERVVLSPGPGRPEDAGICPEAVRRLAGRVPILGVCLGHQCIGQVFGGVVQRARAPRHGKSSLVCHGGGGLFRGVPSPFSAGRYHSLVVASEPFPEALVVTARTEEGEIMALEHRRFPIFGVQFHPESVLTPEGKKILKNFFAVPLPPLQI